MNRYKKQNRTTQQIKEEQINFLLEDVEKNLEEYKRALVLKEKQLSDAKKILASAKNSCDKTVAENKELKGYIQNIKQGFQNYQQQQQAQFLENQKNTTKNENQKDIKKVFMKKNLKANLNQERKKSSKTRQKKSLK